MSNDMTCKTCGGRGYLNPEAVTCPDCKGTGKQPKPTSPVSSPKAGEEMSRQTHYLKTWPRYFEEILNGSKTFEWRVDDRSYAVGDTLVLQEWKPESTNLGCKDGVYTGREIRKTVSYIFHPFGEASNKRQAVMAFAAPPAGQVADSIQADSIASEKVCDHPSTEKAARLLIGLDTVTKQIRSWLEWNTKHRERNDPPLTTNDDTAVMLLPVPYWPSHGSFKHWIELFEESAAAIRAGQVIAHPANSLRGQPEPSLLGRETVQEAIEALQIISDWQNVRIADEHEHSLRDIIRSITDCADRALSSLSPLKE